jgi:hypothetical protein
VEKLSELPFRQNRLSSDANCCSDHNFRLTARCYLPSSQQRSEVVFMELPHWLMAVGAILLVVGIVGVSLDRTAQATTDTGSWEGNQTAEAQTPTNPPSGAAAS